MATYYLAFDVGIINLAYCFSKYDKNLTILDWNIINFSEEQKTCNQLIIKKTKKKTTTKICNKKSLYSNKKNTQYYCECHYNNRDKNIDHSNDNKIIKIAKSSLFENTTRLYEKLNIFFENVINIPYGNITNNTINDTISNANNNNISNNVQFIYPKNINIMIENQPGSLFQTMKTYSIAIYSYFVNKKIMHPNLINDIKFVNAVCKTSNGFVNKINSATNLNLDLFNTYKEKYIENIKKIYQQKLLINKYAKIKKNITMKKITPYDIRKDFSENLATIYKNYINVNYYNIISNINFESYKKKDDLSDALLYVLFSIYCLNGLK